MSQRTARRSDGRSSGAAHVMMVIVAAVVLVGLPACSQNREVRRARPVEVSGRTDVPPILRGTIGAEATISGARPVLVSGLGFVVGLNGTGGGLLPENIAATMERTMGRYGVGQGDTFDGTPLEGRSPAQVLRDPNTAVVLVQAAIPPGLPDDATFDVYVRAINATSLDGGRLWTTDLRLGQAGTENDPTTQQIAQASGAIFINPFAEPGREDDGVTRTIGRVLQGGRVTESLGLELVLNNPNHARARQITSAVNGRFPVPYEREPIARGRDETAVAIRVPAHYRDRAAEFINLLTHVRVDPSFPELAAQRYASTMVNDGFLVDELSLALEAIGDGSLPFLRDLYDSNQLRPRLGALRAGASLGDARAAQTLIRLVEQEDAGLTPALIRLLAPIDAGPRVDLTLRRLLGRDDFTVRVAAYEALADRAARVEFARTLEQASSSRRPMDRAAIERLRDLSSQRLSGATMQGVRRIPVEGKFLLDLVPVGDPLVYITQSAQPRIVVFGEPDDAALAQPLLFSAWSDRLLIANDGPGLPTRLYYRDLQGNTVVLEDIPTRLGELLPILARNPAPGDPRPGLGLSYSEVVGLLYEFNRASATTTTFVTERDRLIAEILSVQEAERITLRPENEDDRELVVFDRPTTQARPQPIAPEDRPSLLTPLNEPRDDGTGGEGTGSPDQR